MTYSVASLQSFQALPKWLSEIRTNSEDDVIVILVGNQCDRDQEREVSREQAARFAKENDIQWCVETSAKTGEGVIDTFVNSAKMIYTRHFKKLKSAAISNANSKGKVVPNSKKNVSRGGSCSC